MLTDMFATRYADRTIWEKFGEPERRLLVQSFRILKEQICPYHNAEGKERPEAKAFWTDLHSRVTMELGLAWLSPPVSRVWPVVNVCETWMFKKFDDNLDPDAFIKRRLSLIELGFRKRGEEIAAESASLKYSIAQAKTQRALAGGGSIHPPERVISWKEFVNLGFQSHVEELNTRFQQAGCQLHYHNGFIQISTDSLTTAHIETPFWSTVADPKWANVDTDMKEAIDGRDTGGRDPAWYAARALESTIKIISNEKKWTHGGEKGPHNFIDNLASKKVGFVAPWEADILKSYFTNVRNPLGHGPGDQPMPALSPELTDWAIETAMAWIRTLVRRSGK